MLRRMAGLGGGWLDLNLGNWGGMLIKAAISATIVLIGISVWHVASYPSRDKQGYTEELDYRISPDPAGGNHSELFSPSPTHQTFKQRTDMEPDRIKGPLNKVHLQDAINLHQDLHEQFSFVFASF